MRETFALIFATSSIMISFLGLALQLGFINVKKKDKYEKYRNSDGLLGRKREE